MTEAEAYGWVVERYLDRLVAIEAFVELVIAENARQNLIAPSTEAQIWNRHVVDSLQLGDHGRDQGLWVDIGSGGGFPGMMIAIVHSHPVMLVEPRRKRANFLYAAASALNLRHVEVRQTTIEKALPASTAVISARAVASVEMLFDAAQSWATAKTRWILPRGQVSDDDMGVLRRRFDTRFHVEQSVTSAASRIIVADGRPA